MLTKVLAVVFAVAVPTVGGLVYMHHSGGCPLSCSKSASCPAEPVATTEETPGCCESLSRTSCMSLENLGCCSDEGGSSCPAEVLTIQPREVK